VTLARGDRVIYSSRTIPGNEKAVGRVINGLVGQGVEVITDRTHLVHVSGHPRRAELADMLAWVRPQIVIPVHGEPLHLAEHAALARQAGIPKTILCRDGDMVRLGPGEAGIIDEIPVGRLYQDGKLLVDAEARTVPDRRRLGFAGIVSVALAISDRGDLAADPEIELTGLPDIDAEGRLIVEITSTAIIDTFENLPRPRRRDPDAVAEAIRRTVRATIGTQWGKKPLCHVHVLIV
jgi:ribonuclease J